MAVPTRQQSLDGHVIHPRQSVQDQPLKTVAGEEKGEKALIAHALAALQVQNLQISSQSLGQKEDAAVRGPSVPPFGPPGAARLFPTVTSVTETWAV